MSLRQSSNNPTQSLKVPIFATFPGIVFDSLKTSKALTTKDTKVHKGIRDLFLLLVPSRPLWLKVLSHIQPNCFHFRIVFDGMYAQLAPEAGALVAAEGQGRIRQAISVDPHRPGPEL